MFVSSGARLGVAAICAALLVAPLVAGRSRSHAASRWGGISSWGPGAGGGARARRRSQSGAAKSGFGDVGSYDGRNFCDRPGRLIAGYGFRGGDPSWPDGLGRRFFAVALRQNRYKMPGLLEGEAPTLMVAGCSSDVPEPWVDVALTRFFKGSYNRQPLQTVSVGG